MSRPPSSSARRQRPLVALATSADWQQLPLDDQLIAPALGRARCDTEVVVWSDPGVDWARFDLILVRSCWDYHQDLRRWLAWVDSVGTLGTGTDSILRNSPAVLAWNARKTYLSSLQELGIPVLPTVWLEAAALRSPADLEDALEATGWKDVVCKPAVSAGALATFRWRQAGQPWLSPSARAELVDAFPELLRRAPVLIQPFCPEIVSEGEWSLLYFGGTFSHAVLKRPAPGDFRVQEKHGGTIVEAIPPASLTAMAERALAAAARSIGGLSVAAPSLTYARVDIVDASGGPMLVELELTEPALFLGNAAGSTPTPADRLAATLAGILKARWCGALPGMPVQY